MRLLISDSDLDGMGSIILSKAFDIKFDKIEISTPQKMNSINIISKISAYDEIVITDLSLDEVNMKKFISERNITIYDHHITSNYLNKKEFTGSISDSSRCGTKIYIEEYVKKHCTINESAKRFVELIDVYDRWQQNNTLWPLACKLNKVFQYHKWNNNYFIEKFAREIQNDYFEFDEEDERNAEIINQEIDYSVDFSDNLLKIFTNNNIRYGITYYLNYSSEVGNKLINKHNLTYILMINNKYQDCVSARSKPNFDLTLINGLHGHKNAAGGKFSAELLENCYNTGTILST